MGLFEPGHIGHLALPNRIVMAPLGRARNDPDTREPGALSVEYYVQRASAGLIISEATHVSPGSVSRPGTGAIHTSGQIAAWRRVTEAVHDAGGRIFQQLFHLGRKADPDRLPGHLPPVAPSAMGPRPRGRRFGRCSLLARAAQAVMRPTISSSACQPRNFFRWIWQRRTRRRCLWRKGIDR